MKFNEMCEFVLDEGFSHYDVITGAPNILKVTGPFVDLLASGESGLMKDKTFVSLMEALAGKSYGSLAFTPQLMLRIMGELFDYQTGGMPIEQVMEFDQIPIKDFTNVEELKEHIDGIVRDELGLPRPEGTGYAKDQKVPGRVGRAVNKIYTWLTKKRKDSEGNKTLITTAKQSEINQTKQATKELENNVAGAEGDYEDEPQEDEEKVIDRLSDVFASDIDDDNEGGLGLADIERLGGSVERRYGHPEDESEWY